MRAKRDRSPSLADEALSCFGERAFGAAPFYNIPNSLRFELAQSSNNPTLRVREALDRSTAVMADLSLDVGRAGLAVQIYFCPNEDSIHRQVLKITRQLKTLRFEVTRPISVYSAQEAQDKAVPDSEPLHRLVVFIDANPLGTAARTWLEQHLGTDFGHSNAMPPGNFYAFNLDKQILVHPYDDRGMDVVGPNFKALQSLYNKRKSWLLNYDREKMDAAFG